MGKHLVYVKRQHHDEKQNQQIQSPFLIAEQSYGADNFNDTEQQKKRNDIRAVLDKNGRYCGDGPDKKIMRILQQLPYFVIAIYPDDTVAEENNAQS